MLSQNKIEAPNFKELEVDEKDQAIVDQQTKGGQLSINNGKIEYSPLTSQPIDVATEVKTALESAKDFADFKEKLTDKLK